MRRFLKSGLATYLIAMGSMLLLVYLTQSRANPNNLTKYHFFLWAAATWWCATKGYSCGLAASLTWWGLIRWLLNLHSWDFHELLLEPERFMVQVLGPLAVSRFVQVKRESERRRKQELTQLVLGISHKFNNILIVIMGNASLIAADLPDSQPLQNKLAAIVQASEDAADLVRQLRDHARHGFVAPVVKDAAAEIEAIGTHHYI